MDEIDFAGRIVIGEGERDEAPMLYIGEQVGRTRRRRDDVPRGRHRGRPARGHQPRRPRPGRRDHRARRVRGGRPDPRAGHVHGEAVRRPGRGRARSTSATPPTENLGRIAEALGRRVARHHGGHPRAAAPRRADRRGPRRPAPGSSSSATATCRPRSRARSRAPASTRSWASAARRRA